MRLTQSTLTKISKRYPDIRFLRGDKFYWSPSKREVTFLEDDANGLEHLLHELSHAALDHTTYTSDIALISMERAAWQFAKTNLAFEYDVTISDDLIQDDLDTYRDWLHARSTCPRCGSNGVQSAKQRYKCLVCHEEWTVNLALHCQLKRYKK